MRQVKLLITFQIIGNIQRIGDIEVTIDVDNQGLMTQTQIREIKAVIRKELEAGVYDMVVFLNVLEFKA